MTTISTNKEKIKVPARYKFQFNGDVSSCNALASMFKDGWELDVFREDDGYHWVILQNYKYLEEIQL